MQTFLPYPSFYKCAVHLDPVRLNKQITETWQMIDTIIENKDNWIAKHSATRMWRGHLTLLACYGDQMFNNFIGRGYSNQHKAGLAIRATGLVARHDTRKTPPQWLGDPCLHSIHRSNLLRKGELDRLAARIKAYTGKRANVWLAANSYGELRDLSIEVMQLLHKKFDDVGTERLWEANFYRQFGWTESMRKGYYWPV